MLGGQHALTMTPHNDKAKGGYCLIIYKHNASLTGGLGYIDTSNNALGYIDTSTP